MSTFTLESIVAELTCVGINKKIYTVEEVGEDNAGCVSIFLEFEHLTAPIISMWVELADEDIGSFNCRMWDGRTLAEHVGEL